MNGQNRVLKCKSKIVEIRSNNRNSTNTDYVHRTSATAIFGRETQPTLISFEERKRPLPPAPVVNWRKLPCNKTLEDVRTFTGLIEDVASFLTCIWFYANNGQDYDDVLKEIDARLADFANSFPGSAFTPKKRSALCISIFRSRNIGAVPITDEGIDFLRHAHELLWKRRRELEAKEKLEREQTDLVSTRHQQSLLCLPSPPWPNPTPRPKNPEPDPKRAS
jgi:hypothetical protein